MKQMFKKLFLILFFLFFSFNLISKTLTIDGLSKLNLEDLQSITSIDIYNSNLNSNDINILLKELSISELIYDLEFSENSDHFLLLINESDLIENSVKTGEIGVVIHKLLRTIQRFSLWSRLFTYFTT